MRVVPSITVDELRGGVSNTNCPVFYPNRSTQVARKSLVPTDPKTFSQRLVRAYVQVLAPYWASISEQQRLDWAAYAATNPVVVPGGTTYINGCAWFSKINLTRLFAHRGVNLNAPIGATPPALVSIGDFTFDPDTGKLDLEVGINNRTEDDFLAVEVSRTYNSQNRVPMLNEWRLVCGIDEDSYPTIAHLTQYTNLSFLQTKLTFILNHWVFVKVTAHRVTGEPGNSIQARFQLTGA